MTKFSELPIGAPRVANIAIPVLDPNEAADADKNKAFTLEELMGAEVLANYATAQTYVNDELLVPGTLYCINGIPAAGDAIIMKAITNSKFSISGVGVFKVSDFHDAGVYSGVSTVTSVAAGTRLGIWTPAIDAAITTGQIVIWNGFHYQCTNAANVNGTNPYVRTTAYTLLTKSSADVGYITEYDNIKWDYDTNTLLKREDKRGNIVENRTCLYPYVSTDYSFKFGDDNTTDNYISAHGEVHNINYVGQFYQNHIIKGLVKLSNLQTGEFSGNVLSLSQLEFVNEAGDFTNNTILTPSGSFDNIPISEGFAGFYKDETSSTFEMELDLDTYSGGTDIGSISAGLSRLIGKWRLSGANGSTLDSMDSDYISCTHPIEFVVENGNNQIFSPQAIGGTPPFYSFVGSSGNKTINGRANAWDSIKVRVNGSYFEIYQVNIIA